MNKEKFMNQPANEMSISELAEAIKIKEKEASEPAPEPKFKIGDKVKAKEKYSCGYCEGAVMTITEIRDSGMYPIICNWGTSKTECFDECALELVKVEPKAEWIDITKECEFRLKNARDGSHFLDVVYNGETIAHGITAANISHPLQIVITLTDKYKVVDFRGNPLDRTTNFKILKKSGG